MLFSSATFLFAFLPVVALLYYLIPKRCTAARNLFLTGASLLFYAWGEPRFVLVMLLVIVSSWLFARKIEASAKSARKGFLLVHHHAVNLPGLNLRPVKCCISLIRSYGLPSLLHNHVDCPALISKQHL